MIGDRTVTVFDDHTGGLSGVYILYCKINFVFVMQTYNFQVVICSTIIYISEHFKMLQHRRYK
jgi:hypothetical protein